MPVPQTVTINLYRNRNDASVVNKQLVHGTQQIKGTFRGECNIITPTLSLEKDVVEATDICELNEFNYLFIVELNRYYFVQNVTIMPTGLMILSLLEDVLQSYKKSIKEMTCFVERCERSDYIDGRIPDSYALPIPRLTVSSTLMSKEAGSYGWRSCENVWKDTYTENTKLSYIITFNTAKFRESAAAVDVYQEWHGPVPKIICTKAYLNKFLEKINSVPASILDHWLQFREGIIKIETIPEIITISDHVKDGVTGRYKLGKDGSAGSMSGGRYQDTDVVSVIDLPTWTVTINTNGDDGTNSVLYGFALHPTDDIVSTDFTVSPTISNAWENSSQFTKYSIKFNPFGEMEIPGDEILGISKLNIHVQHSLITGQAQMYYSTSRNATKRLMGEAKLNFEQPFVVSGDWGSLVETGIKTVATIAIGSKVAGAKETTETTIPVTKTFEFTPDLNAQYTALFNDKTNTLDVTGGNLGSPEKNFATPRLSYSYTQGEPTQKSVSSASSTAKTLNLQNIINSVSGLMNSIPTPEMKGNLKAVLIDLAPQFIRVYREYINPDIHQTGKPCYKLVALKNLALGTNDGGYVKVGSYSFYNFRQTGDPEPLDSELKMIGDRLTEGVIIHT